MVFEFVGFPNPLAAVLGTAVAVFFHGLRIVPWG